MSKEREAIARRRRDLLTIYLIAGSTIRPSTYTTILNFTGHIGVNTASTTTDLDWFRRGGMELTGRNNQAQQDVDKIVDHWKQNRTR